MEDNNNISAENQHKFEEWLANHFPNIETFENKKRRAKLYGSHINKCEELKSCIHFIQLQQRKKLQKEKEFLKLKQSQLAESNKIHNSKQYLNSVIKSENFTLEENRRHPGKRF